MASMQHYSQLTSEQRYQIYALLKKNHTQTDIADIVGVHKSTISREIRRNSSTDRSRFMPRHSRDAKRRFALVFWKVPGNVSNSCYERTGVRNRSVYGYGRLVSRRLATNPSTSTSIGIRAVAAIYTLT